MLPTKEAIRIKAVELWRQDRFKKNDPSFDITPTLHELREGGFIQAARSFLMRDYARAKSEAYEGFNDYLVKYDMSQTCKFGIPFDIEEAEDSNTLISGTNKTGKSRLACNIASILQTFNWKLITFDSAGIWKKISDIPVYHTVRQSHYDRENKTWFYPFPDRSMIYDMSLLKPINQKKFVDSVLERVWLTQVRSPSKLTLIVLEEFQLFGRNLRGSAAQNILRIMSAGRNHKLRVLAITVDLALIDPCLIRLCAQRYYGRLGIEENSKRKFRNYHGGDWCRIVQELDLGYFVYLLREKLKVIHVPLFETKRISKAYDMDIVTAQ